MRQAATNPIGAERRCVSEETSEDGVSKTGCVCVVALAHTPMPVLGRVTPLHGILATRLVQATVQSAHAHTH